MTNLTNNPDIPSDRAIMLREGAKRNVYISLSNTTTDSQQIEIAAAGNVFKDQMNRHRE